MATEIYIGGELNGVEIVGISYPNDKVTKVHLANGSAVAEPNAAFHVLEEPVNEELGETTDETGTTDETETTEVTEDEDGDVTVTEDTESGVTGLENYPEEIDMEEVNVVSDNDLRSYEITGEIKKYNEKGDEGGNLEVGSIQNVPMELGNAWVEKGLAKEVVSGNQA